MSAYALYQPVEKPLPSPGTDLRADTCVTKPRHSPFGAGRPSLPAISRLGIGPNLGARLGPGFFNRLLCHQGDQLPVENLDLVIGPAISLAIGCRDLGRLLAALGVDDRVQVDKPTAVAAVQRTLGYDYHLGDK